jgi:hypothetical protein
MVRLNADTTYEIESMDASFTARRRAKLDLESVP